MGVVCAGDDAFCVPRCAVSRARDRLERLELRYTKLGVNLVVTILAYVFCICQQQ